MNTTAFNSEPIVIVAAKRSPFGSFGGSFKSLTATDLAVQTANAVLETLPNSRDQVDHVIYGNVMQTSSDAAYLSRHVGLRGGLKESVPAVTVNRLCASGFEALADGVRRIRTGEATMILAGGTESMSQSPYVLRSLRFGHKLGNTEMEDSLMTGLTDSYPKLPMAMTAENLAEKYHLDRSQCDQFALESQQKAYAATKDGAFLDEIAPIKILDRQNKETLYSNDEHIRPEANLEGLQKLKAVFKKDGVVTAGNASGMVDGAASVLLTTLSHAKKMGWLVLGQWMGSTVVGCDPKIMGIGPVPAVQALWKSFDLKKESIALYEINEAFAPQVLACQKELQLDSKNLNIHGGAIAIGHPLGASGTRLVTHLLYALQKRGGGLGCASACIGGGQGMSVLLKV